MRFGSEEVAERHHSLSVNFKEVSSILHTYTPILCVCPSPINPRPISARTVITKKNPFVLWFIVASVFNYCKVATRGKIENDQGRVQALYDFSSN